MDDGAFPDECPAGDVVVAEVDLVPEGDSGGPGGRCREHPVEEGLGVGAVEGRRPGPCPAERVEAVAGQESVPVGRQCGRFVEQIEGLKAGGAEVAWIETMSSPDEIRAAAEAAAKVGLPYVYTGSFDTAGKTMMGLHPKDIHGVAADIGDGPVAVGANCGVGASDILSSLLDMTAASPEATIVVKGNCGIPEFRGSEIHYSGTPPLMAEYARLAVDAGARIIGGCCGTSCNHLAAMRLAIDNHTRGERPTLDMIVEKIGPLRNKSANEGPAAPARERRRRA